MTEANCEGGWDSHRWEVGNQNREVGDLIMFCNQCGCELKVSMPIEGYMWEIEAVDEEENVVHLYDRENLEKSLVLEVLEATA